MSCRKDGSFHPFQISIFEELLCYSLLDLPIGQTASAKFELQIEMKNEMQLPKPKPYKHRHSHEYVSLLDILRRMET